MLYTFIGGRTYDTSTFSDEERILYEWMQREAGEARSYLGFQQRTAHGIIEAAKKVSGDKWMEHPLHKIQLDLVERVGINLEQLSRR